MDNKKNKTIIVTVYADDTGLFTEEECDLNNMVYLSVPQWTVEKWYENHANDFKTNTMIDLGISEDDATFERWLDEVYTCDDFLGFYDFCVKMGIIPNVLLP